MASCSVPASPRGIASFSRMTGNSAGMKAGYMSWTKCPLTIVRMFFV